MLGIEKTLRVNGSSNMELLLEEVLNFYIYLETMSFRRKTHPYG